MAIVLQVGDTDDLPPKPDGFPQCGLWSPAKENNHSYEKWRKSSYSGREDEKVSTKQRKAPVGSD